MHWPQPSSGNKNAVEFKEATSANRFELLAAQEIDVLIRTTTWTASRDAELNVAFAPTTFYDGAGIMVKAETELTSVRELDGATICILDGTSTQGPYPTSSPRRVSATRSSPSRPTRSYAQRSSTISATPGLPTSRS